MSSKTVYGIVDFGEFLLKYIFKTKNQARIYLRKFKRSSKNARIRITTKQKLWESKYRKVEKDR